MELLKPSGGSALLPSIQNVSGTTASLAPDTYAELNIVGHETYTIYKINASKDLGSEYTLMMFLVMLILIVVKVKIH